MYSSKHIGLRVRGGMLLWMLIFLSFCPVMAQNATDTLSSVELQELTITEKKYKEVIPSQKLSGKELERLNSHSVADAIRFFSGVQIKDYGGIGGLKTVDIRSMGTNHMGVFYDGIQLGNAQNGQVDLGKYSLDNIEEISLYNGQKSEIFQPAKDFGSAGTIYLRTRRPRFKGDKKYNLRALLRTGSFDLINPSFLWEQKISPQVSSLLNLEYINSSGKYKFRTEKYKDGTPVQDTTAIRQNGDIESFRFEGALHGYFHHALWNAKVYYYDSEKGIPGYIAKGTWSHPQRQWDRNFFTQASLTKEVCNRYDYQINAKYANDYMRYLNPIDTAWTDPSGYKQDGKALDNNFTQQEVYVSFANRFGILPNWDVSLASDFQWNSLHANLTDFVQPRRYTALVAVATALEIGKLKAQASLLGTFVHEKINRSGTSSGVSGQGADAASDKEEYTPAVFLSYNPFRKPEFNIRAFYKKIFRMPTFNDLYYTEIGNKDLRPEYTTQYDIGFQYTYTSARSVLCKMMLQADAYYNEVSDKIIAVPKGNSQYRWMMMNIGYVEIRGIDVKGQFSWSLPRHITLQTNINYTYQKAQDFSDPSENDPRAGTWGRQIAYIPWHNGSFTCGANYRGWEFNYSLIYVGERYHVSANIPINYERPWYTSDLSCAKGFPYKSYNFKVSLEVNNVFNQQYDVVLNYPMPGTNYKLILKAEL